MWAAHSSFSFLFFFFWAIRAPGFSKIDHVNSTEGVSRPPAKYRAVSLACPCSLRSMLSCASVVKVLPPDPLSPTGTSLNHFPFCGLRFCAFLPWSFPFAFLFAHACTQKTNTNCASTPSYHALTCLLNLRSTTLLLTDACIGCSCLMWAGTRTPLGTKVVSQPFDFLCFVVELSLHVVADGNACNRWFTIATFIVS